MYVCRFIIVLLFFVSACSSTQPYISNVYSRWSEAVLPDPEELVFETFLIGDTGEPSVDNSDPVFELLQSMASSAGKQSAVVFLGDNLYPSGLPDSGDTNLSRAEEKLRHQLEFVESLPGRILMLPGNHDWNDSKYGGLQAVLRQERWIEDYLDRGNTFVPDRGFPGPTVIKLSDDIVLIAIDTEWWLTDLEKSFGETGEYDLEEAGDFLLELNDILIRNDDKTILVAGHHPLFSNGTHAGRLPLKKHVFPLTSLLDQAYIPLPGIGSIYPLYLRMVGGPQDLAHPRYKSLRKGLQTVFAPFENLIYASGHEHSLQYFQQEGQHYIVSGSGSKSSYVARGGGAAFSHEINGFARLLHYRDQSVWLEMWSPGPNQNAGHLLFRTRIKPASPASIDAELPIADPTTFPDYSDSTKTLFVTDRYEAGGIKQFFWGSHNRKAWHTPVTVPYLDMGREASGLEPIKRGGGLQTLSLRLEGGDGHQYVLRSIDKDPSKTVPVELQGTIATDIVQDQIASLHPYGAFIIPRLAAAAGVYHTIPKLVYVPDDPRLGVYRETFGGQLMMFEIRPDDDMSDAPNFGFADDVISAQNMFEEVNADNDHRVDQRSFARARLFDMLLSDWDRHKDQWRWSALEPADSLGKVYRPIPRDRDWAFNQMNGFLLSIYKQFDSRFQSFNENYGYLKGLTTNGRDQDRRFTNTLSRQDWIEIADSIRTAMSDAVVASAINDWPRSIVELDGEKFIRILKARRDQLPVIAEQFYELTADVVDFVGSHKHERFEVTRKNDSETEVVVYKTTKKGEIRLERYRRTIYHHETREIRLYGLAGNDQFRVDGEVGHGIKVVAVGGTGDDTFVDTSKVVGSRKNTHFYDTSDMNSFEAGPETRVHQSDDPLINEYNPGGYAPNAKFPRAYFGSNKDDGIFIGGGLLFTRHGFRKAPHSSTHLVQGNVAFKTRAFNVRYDVDIVDLFGSWDLDLTSYYLSPDNIRNFYGLGNETNTEVSDRRFYQARLTEFLVSPSFRQNYEPGITLTLGPKIKFTRVIQDNERFVGTPQAGITDNTFDNQWYAGLTSSFTLDNADRGVNPTQGLIWQNEADMSIGVNNDDVYTTLASDISIFASPSVSPQITFAGRIGASHIFGQFPFFDAVTLGGKSNLRGFRSTRYTGRSNVYNNLELRVSLFHFSSYTAVGDFGLLGFHDLGRVWTDKEDSNVWHQGYGGGFWATFFDAMAMTAVMGFSDDDTTFTLKFGFLF